MEICTVLQKYFAIFMYSCQLSHPSIILANMHPKKSHLNHYLNNFINHELHHCLPAIGNIPHKTKTPHQLKSSTIAFPLHTIMHMHSTQNRLHCNATTCKHKFPYVTANSLLKLSQQRCPTSMKK